MRRVSICLATAFAIAFLAFPQSADARYVEKRPFPLVSVVGVGQVAVQADMAEVTAGVTTEGKTAREAAEANAKAMTAVIAAAREAGIAENAIATSRFNISPVYAQKGRGEAQQLVGYRVSNLVRVKIASIDRTGDILDRLVAAGATDIGGVRFSAAEPSAMRDKARAAAFADAKRKAELYAKAAGAQLGPAVVIAEQDASPPQPMAVRAAAAAPATPIMPGEETLTAVITVSFELLP
jgi:uncharacterized protein